ncbi:hypothetical protein [Stenotrophomonas sp. Iso1]|uniref:hypothetical protein n=1 Tax=Stenotrophomonas sp. Iso1 TaxID=2977283 RepID=UPI0022B7D3A1|nr:hypothetical protein [Stenotrophomonas sp. Iso1]
MHTRLYMDQSRIYLQPADADAIVLPLSLRDLLDAGLQNFPPTELALERAIALTEDALMPYVPALRAHPLEMLIADDGALAALPSLLGRDGNASLRLEIDDVERGFNQVARVAAGMPARAMGLPAQPQFVAALLVVRELMHHVGWKHLQLS